MNIDFFNKSITYIGIISCIVVLLALGFWIMSPTEKFYDDLTYLSNSRLGPIKAGKVPAEIHRPDDELGSKISELYRKDEREPDKLRKIYKKIIETQEASPGAYLTWHTLEEEEIQKNELRAEKELYETDDLESYRKQRRQIKEEWIDAFSVLEEGVEKYPEAEALVERYKVYREDIEEYKEGLRDSD